MDADKLIQEQEEKIKGLRKELEALKISIISETGKLEGMLAMRPPETLSPQTEEQLKAAKPQRMRLGSKKRVVFTLIGAGLRSLEALLKHIPETEIDPRYIKDVIRDGLKDGNLEGHMGFGFDLTAKGKELLSKAPLPSDWRAFVQLSELNSKHDVQEIDDKKYRTLGIQMIGIEDSELDIPDILR